MNGQLNSVVCCLAETPPSDLAPLAQRVIDDGRWQCDSREMGLEALRMPPVLTSLVTQ